MIKRLRTKFICINMLIVTIMLGIIFAMVLHFTSNSMEMESIRMMQSAAGMHGRHPGPRNFFLTVQLDGEAKIIDTKGEDYGLTEEQIAQVAALAAREQAQVGVLEQFDLRYCRVPAPNGINIVFGDISTERSMLTNLVRDCLIIGVISLCVFFVISLLLARWAVKPVEQAWTDQRQFVADASHELKTPLTVILTNAELLRSPDYSAEQKKGFAQSVLTMSHQMRGLVERLLELARVDAGRAATAKTRLDLQPVIADIVLSFEVMFFEKGLELQYDLGENVPVFASESHLCQVAEILLDNAMKYSQLGTTKVSLCRQGHWAIFCVSNPGVPIAPEDLKNIFKRFYRVDAARSMNGSYGLGLSIAEGIVKDHGGKIRAESENGMNTFTVSIPLIK